MLLPVVVSVKIPIEQPGIVHWHDECPGWTPGHNVGCRFERGIRSKMYNTVFQDPSGGRDFPLTLSCIQTFSTFIKPFGTFGLRAFVLIRPSQVFKHKQTFRMAVTKCKKPHCPPRSGIRFLFFLQPCRA